MALGSVEVETGMGIGSYFSVHEGQGQKVWDAFSHF